MSGTPGRAPLPVGTKRLINGYVSVKQEDGTWEYEHHRIAKYKLGRPLNDNERVCFVDGNRTNLDPDNIVVRWKLPDKRYKRRAHLRRKLLEAEAKVRDLRRQLDAMPLDQNQEDRIAAVSEGRGGRPYKPAPKQKGNN